MEYRMPAYYNEFKCIADKCPCSCCAGWGIVIDDKSMDKYNALPEGKKEYVLSHIDIKETMFKQNSLRCAFLNNNNLCDLYTNVGEDYLCQTCRRYPRHFEIYGDLIEAALSISCPVVAGMLLKNESKDIFKHRKTDKKTKRRKEIDNRLFAVLLDIRSRLFCISSNRHYNIDDRMFTLLTLCDKLQTKIYDYEKLHIKFFSSDIKHSIIDLINNYTYFKSNDLKYNKRYTYMKNYLDMYLGLENINEAWPAIVEEIIDSLYRNLSEEEYTDLYKEFDAAFLDKEYEYEHILIYFLYTYFLGGVYDYNIIGMVRFSVISTMFIREMNFAKWLANGKSLNIEERITNTYTYSRQIEHSDDNLTSLQGIMTAHPMFVTENIL